MNDIFYLNDGWIFDPDYTDEFKKAEYICTDLPIVRLPHSVVQTPYDYFSENIYQTVSGYRKSFFVKEEWKDKIFLLTIDGAAHRAELYINGELASIHECGYTAFTTDITPFLYIGKYNIIVIKLDSNETLNQPPFGYVIDYMTYGGIYRGITLEIKERTYIKDLFIKPSVLSPLPCSEMIKGQLVSDIEISGDTSYSYLKQYLTKKDDDEHLAESVIPLDNQDSHNFSLELVVDDIKLWDTVDPYLYVLHTELYKEEKLLDSRIDNIGFRQAVFKKDGFYLNGKKLLIRGLNRHQSYPFVGYAMPSSMQKADADILKYELSLNAVRTSHYPQSHDFISRCDEIGLLVFTEIPGWQHIGDKEWKDIAVKNTAEMVKQYRNHTSIILWGVRINESVDDDDLYSLTNETAHELDPTRQTGGVRYLKKSHLLEDVYTYNDFVHEGNNPGCESKKNVTSDIEKPYLVTEYCGHMYPTKMFDDELHFQQHMLRHAKVLDDIASSNDICGSFGWCMADYNTHKDFGSGDRICYHGVLDMFRNPKAAAYLYKAQECNDDVLYVSSQMDIGEHPAASLGKVYIVSNADSVRMFKNGRFLKEYTKDGSSFKNISHGPILIDDYVGKRLEDEEGYDKNKSDLAKDILNYITINGYGKLPPSILFKAAKGMIRYGLTFQDAYRLNGKYIGNWGDGSTVFRFEGIKDGKIVSTVEKAPVTSLFINTKVSNDVLVERETYDVASIRISIVDQNGNQVRFFNDHLDIDIEGPAEIIGPKTISIRGGSGGTYIKTIGKEGEASLKIFGDQVGKSVIDFKIKIDEINKI